jgi:hypothetical protein
VIAKSDAEMAACDTGLTFRKMQHLGAEIADVGAQSTSSRAFNRASPGEYECTPQFTLSSERMINALLPSNLGLNQGSEGTFRWWSYGTIPGALNADGVESLTTTPNILFLFVALFVQACRNDSSGA